MLQEYLKDWAFREIIWVRRLWQVSCVCGHSQAAEDSYCALPLIIATCQVMFSSLLHFASLPLPGLVKSLSLTSQARLADKTGCWSAPISPFTCSRAPHSWGRHRGEVVTYSKCNGNFQNEWFSTSYNYSSLGHSKSARSKAIQVTGNRGVCSQNPQLMLMLRSRLKDIAKY